MFQIYQMNDQYFTEFIKRKDINNGAIITILIIAWISGYIWRGLVFT